MINERVSKLVWKETSRQVEEMTKHHVLTGETRESLEGLRAVAFHVLGSVAFGLSRGWNEQPHEASEIGVEMSYIDVIYTVACNIVPSALLPVSFLLLPFMPAAVKRIGHSVLAYPEHTKLMLEQEREFFRQDSMRDCIMSALVKASDEEHRLFTKTTLKRGLSEKELQGNMFILTLAGFDTTANTMAYAITRLAIDLKLQDWIVEEVRHVAASGETSYEKVFPRLVRCLALMVSRGLV